MVDQLRKAVVETRDDVNALVKSRFWFALAMATIVKTKRADFITLQSKKERLVVKHSLRMWLDDGKRARCAAES